jgi:hypothetical protein
MPALARMSLVECVLIDRSDFAFANPRAMNGFICRLILLLACAACCGCASWQQTAAKGNSLLKPIDMAADSVALEIVSVRFPLGDETLNNTMWTEINEQQLPLETRRKFNESGLRVGIVGGQMPAKLGELITAAEQQPATLSEAAAKIGTPTPLTRQRMQLHSGWHGEIIASKTYPELPLLVHEANGLSGRTYPQAQCVLNAQTEALGDQRLKLHVTPEIQYGEPRQQWVSEDGMLRPQAGKPKRTFDELAFNTVLAKDQMLVITCLPSKPGSLGSFFFTEPSATTGAEDLQLQQKITVVRFTESRFNDLFVKQP